MKLASIHRGRYGNRFTLTVDFRDERRRRLRQLVWASALAGSAFYFGNRYYQQQRNDTVLKTRPAREGMIRAFQFDTFLRKEIPTSVWKAMGGELL